MKKRMGKTAKVMKITPNVPSIPTTCIGAKFLFFMKVSSITICTAPTNCPAKIIDIPLFNCNKNKKITDNIKENKKKNKKNNKEMKKIIRK